MGSASLRMKGTSVVTLGRWRIDFAVWRRRDSWPDRDGFYWWDRYTSPVYVRGVYNWRGRFVQFGPLYLAVMRECGDG